MLLVGLSFQEWHRLTAKDSNALWLLPSFCLCIAAIFIAIPYSLYFVLGFPFLGHLVSFSIKEKKASLIVLSSNLWLALTLLPLILLTIPQKEAQPVWILLATIPIWFGDSFGLFVGKSIGKKPLAPTISPNKTVEGAIANFVACVVAAIGLSYLYKIAPTTGLLIGLNSGIIGQAGDLFQSHLKRMADLKDSGSILPGHGGVLDRIDSLMTAVPVTLGILVLFGHVSF